MWFSEPHECIQHLAVQAVTHPIMNRARRCLTSVIEPTTMSERRSPYIKSAGEMGIYIKEVFVHSSLHSTSMIVSLVTAIFNW